MDSSPVWNRRRRIQEGTHPMHCSGEKWTCARQNCRLYRQMKRCRQPSSGRRRGRQLSAAAGRRGYSKEWTPLNVAGCPRATLGEGVVRRRWYPTEAGGARRVRATSGLAASRRHPDRRRVVALYRLVASRSRTSAHRVQALSSIAVRRRPLPTSADRSVPRSNRQAYEVGHRHQEACRPVGCLSRRAACRRARPRSSVAGSRRHGNIPGGLPER